MSTRTEITITFSVDSLDEQQVRQILVAAIKEGAAIAQTPENVTAFDFATMASAGCLERIDWNVVREEWKTIKG